jgi:uroporphyrinogen III methyltransferase/synthase
LGRVYLIGAGPGDKELITIKGIKLIKRADAIIYDRLANTEILEYAKEGAILIPVGKTPYSDGIKQEEINQIIVDTAKKYQRVIRLKGGDSFVFGRGAEEILYLKENNIPFFVVPGITSAIAVPESLLIPVTHREISRSFHVITGHTNGNGEEIYEDFSHLAKLKGTLVFLMGLKNLSDITNKLIENGMDGETGVSIISEGTRVSKKMVRGKLFNIVDIVRKEGIKSPAVIVIGGVTDIGLNDEGDKILNKKVLGLCATDSFLEKLEDGIDEYDYELIRICRMKTLINEEDYYLEKLNYYRYIVFSSMNSIHLFFKKLKDKKIDLRVLKNTLFATVGEGTKKTLLEYGFISDFTPKTFTTKALAEELAPLINEGEKVLIPSAKRGSNYMRDYFKEKNISFDAPHFYDVLGELNENIKYIDNIDYMIFASGSGVIDTFELLKEKNLSFNKDTVFAVIGEPTYNVLLDYGIKADIIAKEHSAKGLLKEISEYIEKSL